MSQASAYKLLNDLLLGKPDFDGKYSDNVPLADQRRQRAEVIEILNRLHQQPGVILADEVGMGKTFVALAVACCIAKQSNRGPVVIMTPPALLEKWVSDLRTFCELYLPAERVVNRSDPETTTAQLRRQRTLRFGTARNSVELLKLMDDLPREQCHLVFLTQTAMSRQQSDIWVRFALIREALRRHGRGHATRLIEVKKVIHRFMGELLQAIGTQSAHDWGSELWQHLLLSDPATWMETYNANSTRIKLNDDPVPQAVLDVLSDNTFDLKPLAEALKEMPLRDSENRRNRITAVRQTLRKIESSVWKDLLAETRWKSPLLVIDEAHHLKNPDAGLAQQLQLQSQSSESVVKTGHGAMAETFDKMLFLTATPFELGHLELIRILSRFGDTRWHHASKMEMNKIQFDSDLIDLKQSLTEVQRSAVALQRCWTLLPTEDHAQDAEVDQWWDRLLQLDASRRTTRQQALVDVFTETRNWYAKAQKQICPWIVRHNKGDFWSEPSSGPDKRSIRRRKKLTGDLALKTPVSGGIEVPTDQLLPFFLAARSAVTPGKDLLGEALCSSYEAFRDTRDNRNAGKDEQDSMDSFDEDDLTHSSWYLEEFDTALNTSGGGVHPKVASTVQLAADLWEAGEKVLVFAFYRHTCRALQKHISNEIFHRTLGLARKRLNNVDGAAEDEIHRRISQIHDRYFDKAETRGGQALRNALQAIVSRRQHAAADLISDEQAEQLATIMRRFLRVKSTLVRCFPIDKYESMEPHMAVRSALDREDGSGQSWRRKFESFIDFLTHRCGTAERADIVDALLRITTGDRAVSSDQTAGGKNPDVDDDRVMILANVQVATGDTPSEQRVRQMRAFNTPFFPDVFVCSQVMSEGVDLHRYCRHVIHHDLAWNPSQIEQRTGRVDRLGCKAENQHPIHVYLPFIAGASDERQFRVMSDREQWFRVVMGQEDVARLIPAESDSDHRQLPSAFLKEMAFDLSVYSGE